jgi:hypothetical protein
MGDLADMKLKIVTFLVVMFSLLLFLVWCDAMIEAARHQPKQEIPTGKGL